MSTEPRPRRRPRLPLPVGAFLVVAGAYVLLKLVRPVIPESVILLYMGFIVVGVLIHVTLDDERIGRCRDFFLASRDEPRGRRGLRWALLAVAPLIAGWWAYDAVRPEYAPPVEIFQRHPTVPAEVLARIEVPEWAASPAAWSEQAIAEGRALYEANCAVCHGENLDGQGPAASGFRYPIRPANFRDAGTIAQLTLRYVYWRLETGGIHNEFQSAMPRWVAPSGAKVPTVHSYDFEREEAWKVILYLYHATGFQPRLE